jgi:hypothetical protein
VRLLNLFKNERAFTDYLYDEDKGVTPNEMGDAVLELNHQLFGVGHDNDGNAYPSQLDGPPNLDLYNGFMNAAGLSLATYSRNSAAPSSLADDWFNAITDDENPENAAALTLLMREGGEAGGEYDPTFIDRLGSELLRWEKDQDGAVWGPKAQEAGVWIRDPDKVDVTEYTDEYGDPVYSVHGGIATDGLANVLGAMGSSPEGAQRFFMNGDGTVDEDRLDYLMLERSFTEDRGVVGGTTYSDEGDGLGEALQAAIIGGVEGEDGDWTRDEADRLVNDVFGIIAHNSGTEDMEDLGTEDAGGKPDGDADGSWHVWRDMTDSLGAIGAGYADDIYATVSDRVEDSSTTRLDLTEDQLKIVVGEIGHTENKTGIETLLAGVANSGIQREVGVLVHEWKDDAGDPSLFAFDRDSGAPTLDVSDIGGVLGELVDASVTVQKDEEMTEEVRRAYAAKAFEFGTSFLPGAGKILGAGANEALTTTFDFAQGEAISAMQSAIEDAPPSTADEYLQGSRTTMNDSMRYALANELLQQGLLGEQPNPDRPDDVYPGVDGAITNAVPGTDGERVVFDSDLFFNQEPDEGWTAEERRAWNAWQDSEPEAILSALTEQMISAFDTEMNKGG